MAFDSRRGVDQPRSLVAHLEAELARLQAEASNIPVHASGDHAAHVASTTVRSKAARLAATAMAPHRDAFKQTNLLPLTARSFLTSSPVPYHVAQASPSVAEPVPSAPSLPRATPISQVPRHVVDVMLKHYCGNYRPQYPTIDEVDLYKACDRVYNDLQPSDFDIFCVAITLAISVCSCPDWKPPHLSARLSADNRPDQHTHVPRRD